MPWVWTAVNLRRKNRRCRQDGAALTQKGLGGILRRLQQQGEHFKPRLILVRQRSHSPQVPLDLNFANSRLRRIDCCEWRYSPLLLFKVAFQGRYRPTQAVSCAYKYDTKYRSVRFRPCLPLSGYERSVPPKARVRHFLLPCPFRRGGWVLAGAFCSDGAGDCCSCRAADQWGVSSFSGRDSS